LIGQVRRDGEPYPANPNWHDCAFNGDLPPTKEADAMKESYQKEEHCSDQRKSSLRHFQPPNNLGSNVKAVKQFEVAGNVAGDRASVD
jgi:hypothetical protein